MCTDSGEHGLSSTSPFALSTLGFAATHFLVSEKEIRNAGLLVFEVNDESKAHGLISPKIKIVQVQSVKELGEDKFGGAEGLASEKTKRATKSEVKWLAKCETAKREGKTAPDQPDAVRKEKNKDKPDWWNFVCLNQSYRNMLKVCNKGYWFNLRGSNSLRQKPSTVVG